MQLSVTSDRHRLTDSLRHRLRRITRGFSDVFNCSYEVVQRDGLLRRSWSRFCLLPVFALFIVVLYSAIVSKRHGQPDPHAPRPPLWRSFPQVNGYYSGIRSLVQSDRTPVTCTQHKIPCPNSKSTKGEASAVYPEPFRYDPYPQYASEQYRNEFGVVRQCSLTDDDNSSFPEIWAYIINSCATPQPLLGSYSDIGLRSDVCFDRYGRYGAYGLGYAHDKGGTNQSLHGDMGGVDVVLSPNRLRNRSNIDLGLAQARCNELNKHRFARSAVATRPDGESEEKYQTPSKKRLKLQSRSVVVLRLWEKFDYTEHAKLYIRSLVSELNLGSGGEYDIHLLVEVKNLTAPIWASQQVYDEVLNASVPAEFRSMATLWSERQMEVVYPGPFQPQFAWHGPIHWVTRSMHFALQLFASHHPEYDFFWNWEMDIRYVGHWYEFFSRTTSWAKDQPREQLWERSGRFYIPALYGDWANFSKVTTELSHKNDSVLPRKPAGSCNAPLYGVGEEADFLTLDPIFDPEDTDWIYRNDVSGYPDTEPIPVRRASIITASRLSRKLIQTMHEETYVNRHTMASEMFPVTMALHHNLKAVFVPHPVFFDREWPPAYADSVFNGGPNGQTGGYQNTVFGDMQHRLQGASYYFNSGFGPALWRRWLGYIENGEGGPADELGKGSCGRMCLRSMLLHPVKYETVKLY